MRLRCTIFRVCSHVQVNPESADEVEMDSMWSRIGGNRGESILDDKTVSLVHQQSSSLFTTC